MKRLLLSATIVLSVIEPLLAAEPARSRSAVIIQLRDGSRLRGIPQVDEVPLDASFGRKAIPLRLIESVVFRPDRETAEVFLRGGDQIRGGVGWKKLALVTVFGKIDVPTPQATRLSVVPIGVPPELIFWNRLDESPSIVGPEVEFLEFDKFVPGKVGYGASVAENHKWGFRLPADVLDDLDAGTIEFWAQVVRKPPTVSQGAGPLYDFLDGPIRLMYSSNDGYKHGKFSLSTSGYFVYTEFPSETKETDLLGEPGAWTHYAIVWDNDGIKAADDAKLAFYVNGKLHGRYELTRLYSWQRKPWTDAKYLTFHRNRNGFAGAMIYDELKIWNRARQEFPAATGDAAAPEQSEAPRFTADLRDGSRLLGALAVAEIKIATKAVGEVTVSCGQIESVTFDEDDSEATIVLDNEDVLVGDVQLDRLPLKMILGKVEIPLEQVAALTRTSTAVKKTGGEP